MEIEIFMKQSGLFMPFVPIRVGEFELPAKRETLTVCGTHTTVHCSLAHVYV
jgi:hypothetical protein